MGARFYVGSVAAVLTFTCTQASAEDASGRISVEIGAGFAGDYDDSEMWEHGYTAGVSGWWWASESVYLGAAFGLTRWSYRPDEVIASLVPAGATLLIEQSTGDLEILELVPSVRWERDEVLPARLGFFLQGGAGVAYVKTFALTETQYDAGAGPQDADFEINESDVHWEGVAAAGLTRPVSVGSWLELFSSYRAIVMDEPAHVFAVSIGFRIEI